LQRNATKSVRFRRFTSLFLYCRVKVSLVSIRLLGSTAHDRVHFTVAAMTASNPIIRVRYCHVIIKIESRIQYTQSTRFQILTKLKIYTKSFLIYSALYSVGGPRQLSRYSNSLQAGPFGDRIPVRARFSAPVETEPGVNPVSYAIGTGSLYRE
jgi:hypothetical protein